MSKAKKDTKTTKYAIVQNFNIELLVKQVNNLLENNYSIAGGISTIMSVADHNQILYTQALTYESKE